MWYNRTMEEVKMFDLSNFGLIIGNFGMAAFLLADNLIAALVFGIVGLFSCFVHFEIGCRKTKKQEKETE